MSKRLSAQTRGNLKADLVSAATRPEGCIWTALLRGGDQQSKRMAAWAYAEEKCWATVTREGQKVTFTISEQGREIARSPKAIPAQ